MVSHMSQTPDVLKVSVSEEIKTSDVPPGGAAPVAKRTPEEDAAEAKRLLGLYVEPHKTKSLWITSKDIGRIVSEGRDMADLCFLPFGMNPSALALAHPQVSTTPLRFFVFAEGKVIINPVITAHTKYPVYETEGCMSFPMSKAKTLVPRYNKITVTYQSLGVKAGETEPSLTEPITEELHGIMSRVFQHEIGHLNGGCIYDEDFSPENSIGFGVGTPEIKQEELLKLYEEKAKE